jgi:hypothetical protein
VEGRGWQVVEREGFDMAESEKESWMERGSKGRRDGKIVTFFYTALRAFLKKSKNDAPDMAFPQLTWHCHCWVVRTMSDVGDHAGCC